MNERLRQKKLENHKINSPKIVGTTPMIIINPPSEMLKGFPDNATLIQQGEISVKYF